MELFSLGIGNYTEKDIREAARAFTGWEIRNGKFHNNKAQFDSSEKTVLGKKGNWKGEDIVRICLDQPACPRFIVRKLYRFLISEADNPSAELIDPLARQFANGFDFGKLVETVLRSNLFFSEHAYRARIKAPVDYVLGMARGLEAKMGTQNGASNLTTLVGKPRPERVPPAVGQGMGRRTDLAQWPNAPLPPEPGARHGPPARGLQVAGDRPGIGRGARQKGRPGAGRLLPRPVPPG